MKLDTNADVLATLHPQVCSFTHSRDAFHQELWEQINEIMDSKIQQIFGDRGNVLSMILDGYKL
jgi:hypothetical protein